MLLGTILVALMAFTSANVISSHSFSGGSSSSITEYSDGHSMYVIDDLRCYIDKENGIEVKKCRKGILGQFHPMTPNEEAIIEALIRKENQAQAQIHTSVKSFNNVMQRKMQGMNDMMSQMQQQMQAAFGSFG